MKRSTTEQIVKVIYRFYDIDEIIDAKKVLYHKFPQLGDYPTRKTSINRSEQEAHTIDIVESLVELDSQGINVIFVAKNLNRVPKCDPHETDHISILEKIRKLEGRLNSAENELSENKVQILNMSDKFVKIDSRVISCEKNMLDMATIGVEKDTSYSTIVKSSIDHKRPPAREPIELRGPQDKSSARCKLVSGGGARGDGGADGIWGPPEGVDDPGDAASQKTEDKTDNTDGFTLQRDQVRREKRRQRSRAVVTGTSGIGNFLGGPPPLRDFFLYRVMKPATADDVAEHHYNSVSYDHDKMLLLKSRISDSIKHRCESGVKCTNHVRHITVKDIQSSVKQLKCDKKDGTVNMYTNHVINGTDYLFCCHYCLQLCYYMDIVHYLCFTVP